MIENASRLVHLAPAHLGRADPAVRAQGHRRAAPAHAGADRSGRRARREGRHRCLVRPGCRPSCWAPTRRTIDKVTDVMDVWADSGVSFECVAQGAPGDRGAGGAVPGRLRPASRLVPQFAADVRGAVRARAVQRVLTHGFTVDEKGRKMSKSLGNVVAPQTRSCQTLGADVLRLWVAATDYTSEMSVLRRDPEAHVATPTAACATPLRFLLGNLHGFDPARTMRCRSTSWWRSTAWAVARAAALQDESRRGLSRLPVPCRSTSRCTTSASWTSAASTWTCSRTACTPRRRTATRAARRRPRCCTSLQAMVRWLAPILSFTAEEIWQLAAGRDARAVGVPDHLA